MFQSLMRPSNVVNRLWNGLRLVYSDLNSSTLTGAIDVIIVKQEDGTYSCGPFHVCFGKMGALLPTDLLVDIYINGEYVKDLNMRLGNAGEAFFVEEADENEELTSDEIYQPIKPHRVMSMDEINTFEPISDEVISSTPQQISSRESRATSNDFDNKRIRTRCRSVDRGDDSTDVDHLTDNNYPTASSCTIVDIVTDQPNSTLYSCLSDSVLHVPEASVNENSNNIKNFTWDWGNFPSEIQLSSNNLTTTPSSSSQFTNGLKNNSGLDQPLHLNIDQINDKRIPLPPTPGDGIFLDDLIQSQSNPLLKETYIYSQRDVERSMGSPSSWRGSTEGLNGNHDAGYKSDGERSLSPIPICPPPIYDMKLSLCGGLTKESTPTIENFHQHLVSFNDFSKDPEKILSDSNLVVLYNERYLSWSAVAPQLLSILTYHKNLPTTIIQKLEEQHIPKRTRRKAWFSWGTRQNYSPEKMSTAAAATATTTTSSSTTNNNVAEKSSSPTSSGSDEDNHNKKDVDYCLSSSLEQETRATTLPIDFNLKKEKSLVNNKKPKVIIYKKVNRLSHEKIVKLNLQEGYNEIEYRVITRWQGTATCKASIFLWNYYDKLVISDVDGTITRSDILGHVFPLIGRDWTQIGIAKLYNMISQNGYQFIYLSARAIGQSEVTRRYITTVLQDGKMQLPKGPILLSPNSLLNALHREVIEKRPDIFKIQCLKDVQKLFPVINNPFFSGFGNRPTDVKTYSTIGIPDCRIFTVDHEGNIHHEKMFQCKTNFTQLTELVDFVFPPRRNVIDDSVNPLEYSDFCYWREPVPQLL